MKENYQWDYNIKVKTKEGTYEYEKETLDNIDKIIAKHPDYDLIHAVCNKPKTLVKKPGGQYGKNTKNR